MSLTASIHRGRRINSEKPALIYKERTTTYGELHEVVGRLAGGLSKLWLEQGSRVGILAVNSDRPIISFYASAWAGLVPNYLNVRWSAYELSQSIDDCTASVLMVDDTFLEMGQELVKRCESVKALIYIGDRTEDLPEGVLTFADMAKEDAIADRSSKGSDVAFLNYTGGTTGKGKGVIHTHDGHIAAMKVALTEDLFLRDTTMLVAPLFHIGGITVSCANLMAGNTIVIPVVFDPALVLKMIGEYQIKHIFMVPTMMQMMIAHPEFGQHDINALEQIAYGASPIDETLLDQLQELMPTVKFMQVYGQTECVPATVLHAQDHSIKGRELKRTRSAGMPAYGVDIEIRCPHAGTPLPAGEIGEIALRAPMRMAGYWNNQEKTDEVFDGDWMLTGDAGYLDQDGYMHIVDRIKDMIISGGENIYSLEVENVICLHDAVAQAAVVGLPHEKWGEMVHAEVVLKPGVTVTEEELTAHCREYLAGYKVARSMTYTDALPLTAVGKIDKVAIRNKRSA